MLFSVVVLISIKICIFPLVTGQVTRARNILHASEHGPMYYYDYYANGDEDDSDDSNKREDESLEKNQSPLWRMYGVPSPEYDEIAKTPDAAVSYSSFVVTEVESNMTSSGPTEIDQLAVITKTLLNGTMEEVKKLDRAQVILNLGEINRIKLSLTRKLAIWNMIVDVTPINKLTRFDLVTAGSILLNIPEMDLYNFNYSDWDLVDYLGTLPGLSRRKTGVIGYALKKAWGTNMILNVDYVNRIKGLLCAFSPQELDTMTPTEFGLIEKEVFQNIRACTPRQMKVLIEKAKSSIVFGPTQAWTSNNTYRIALLVAYLNEYDLRSLRPEAMEGIEYPTIKAMSKEKLLMLNEDQISYLNDLSLAALRRIIGIHSNNNKDMLQSCNHLVFGVLCLMCFKKN